MQGAVVILLTVRIGVLAVRIVCLLSVEWDVKVKLL